MALYTSYYTRQLALRPEAIGGGELQQEGEKTLQKSVARRTVDYTAPYVTWFERRYQIRTPADVPALPPVAAGALQLLPPLAYVHQPATSFNIKFAGQAPSKTRSSINVAVWTPDGRRCLTGTQAGEFTMWGGSSFQFETIIQSHETPVRTMTFTHNGNFLVSGDDAGNVRYWKTNLELVKSVSAHKEAVRQLSFAPSDLKYCTGSDDSTIRVWDFARVQTELVLAGHGGDVKCVDWHPHKSLLVSGSKDGLVKLWCPKSGRNLGTLHGHKGTIMQTQWNANGNWVLTASRDQTCKLYDVRMQRELASFRGHNRDVTYACWHPTHEELFVSGGHDGSMIFWLASRQAPQAEVRGAHEASIWAAAWHPAGHLLATGSADYAVKFWCRCRPGDPFFEQQQEEQRELAALAAESEPVPAPRPTALQAAPTTFGTGAAGGAIPGIGDAVAMPVLPQATAVFDVFSIRQEAYDQRGAGRGAADGGPAAAAQGGGSGGAGGRRSPAPPRRGGRGGGEEDPGRRPAPGRAPSGDRAEQRRDRSGERRRDRSPDRRRAGERDRSGERKRRRSRSPPAPRQQQQQQQRGPPLSPAAADAKLAFFPIPRRHPAPSVEARQPPFAHQQYERQQQQQRPPLGMHGGGPPPFAQQGAPHHMQQGQPQGQQWPPGQQHDMPPQQQQQGPPFDQRPPFRGGGGGGRGRGRGRGGRW